MATTKTTPRDRDPIPTRVVSTRDDAYRDDAYVGATRPRALSWGAVLGGAVAALGVWAMLYVMGLAFGLSAIDADDPGSVKGSSIFTGIWSLVTPLIALFVGGIVAGRTAGAQTRMQGALHGLVMWGVTTLAGAWLVANILGAIVGGVATVASAATKTGAGAVEAVASKAGGATDVARSFGLDAEDALRPINDRLSAEGKPTIEPEELEAATRDVVREGVQQGRIDRELLTVNLAENTDLSRTDAEEVAGRIESQFDAAKAQTSERLSDAATKAQTTALEAADKTGKAFFGVFGALFLGMVSAIAGAAVGVSRRQRAFATAPDPVERTTVDTRRDVPAT